MKRIVLLGLISLIVETWSDSISSTVKTKIEPNEYSLSLKNNVESYGTGVDIEHILDKDENDEYEPKRFPTEKPKKIGRKKNNSFEYSWTFLK